MTCPSDRVFTPAFRAGKASAWARVLEALTKDRNNEYLMLTPLWFALTDSLRPERGAKIRLRGVPEEIDHQNPNAR
jgi:hypothetical protein